MTIHKSMVGYTNEHAIEALVMCLVNVLNESPQPSFLMEQAFSMIRGNTNLKKGAPQQAEA